MNPLTLFSFSLGAASLIGLLLAVLRDQRTPRALFKILCSAGFLLLALSLGLKTFFATWIFVGLSLSALGDVFLIFRSSKTFLFGLISFLLAHLAYILAFVQVATLSLWALALALSLAALWVRWLWPYLVGWRVPVLAYCLVIALMLFSALGVNNPVIRLGAILFVLSDVFVARQRFVAAGHLNPLVGLPLYYAGQYLLAWAIR